MTPGFLELLFWKGSAYQSCVIQCLDSDNVPVDLADPAPWIPKAEVRDEFGVLKFDLGITVTDAANGEIEIAFTDTETEQFPVGNFKWDLLFEHPTQGIIGPYVQGPVYVRDPVTQPA